MPDPLATAAVPDPAPGEARGQCHCGQVRFVARFPSRFCCHCHCQSCRKSHASGVVTWIGFQSEQVAIVSGNEELVGYESSPGTRRSFCRVCGTKLFFESTRWPGETHIALAAFTSAVDRAPEGDVFYEEHVAWLPWPHEPAPATAQRGISGLILAGGQGRRMGSADKGLVRLRGQPMVRHVLDRFAPQVDEILINANRNIAEYEALGHPVIRDQIDGFAGPLAGFHAGLTQAKHPLLATVPCDSPFLPLDLVARLLAGLEAQHADLAVARTLDQPHPVFALVRRDVLPHLTRFLEGGGRKIDAWYATLKSVEVVFDDEAEAFRNINTADELAEASR
jgi:molybdopterin-guanine dinucleotide biosynthesis protein A